EFGEFCHCLVLSDRRSTFRRRLSAVLWVTYPLQRLADKKSALKSSLAGRRGNTLCQSATGYANGQRSRWPLLCAGSHVPSRCCSLILVSSSMTNKVRSRWAFSFMWIVPSLICMHSWYTGGIAALACVRVCAADAEQISFAANENAAVGDRGGRVTVFAQR